MSKKLELPEMLFKGVYIYPEMHYYPACDKSRALFMLMKCDNIKAAQFPIIAELGFRIVLGGDNRQTAAEMRKLKMDYVSDDMKIEYVGEEV